MIPRASRAFRDAIAKHDCVHDTMRRLRAKAGRLIGQASMERRATGLACDNYCFNLYYNINNLQQISVTFIESIFINLIVSLYSWLDSGLAVGRFLLGSLAQLTQVMANCPETTTESIPSPVPSHSRRRPAKVWSGGSASETLVIEYQGAGGDEHRAGQRHGRPRDRR